MSEPETCQAGAAAPFWNNSGQATADGKSSNLRERKVQKHKDCCVPGRRRRGMLSKAKDSDQGKFIVFVSHGRALSMHAQRSCYLVRGSLRKE